MIEIERGPGWAGYSMIDEIKVFDMTPIQAGHIVDLLIKSGKPPADMTELEREAVRIVWAEIHRQLEPIRSALADFAAALSSTAAALIGYSLEARAEREVSRQTFPGSRPAWQRRG